MEPATTRYQSENVSLKKHVFFYVEHTNQKCPQRHLQEIRGNKTLHSIQWTETSFHLKVRELMCYCEFCSYENYDDDLNKDYVSNWEERAIEGKPTRAVVAQQQESRPCL